MSDHIIEKLKNEFDGSWAIWSEEFPKEGCIEEKVGKEQNQEAIYELIKERKNKINPNVVLLGSNPSEGLKYPYHNFHSTQRKNNDNKLKEFIQDNDLKNIKGAYMTDLQKEETEPDSNKTREPTSKDYEKFFKELNFLDQHDYKIICFGDKVFNKFEDKFDTETILIGESIKEYYEGGESSKVKKIKVNWKGKNLNFYRVWHYSNWGTHQNKVKELEEQLKFLNKNEI